MGDSLCEKAVNMVQRLSKMKSRVQLALEELNGAVDNLDHAKHSKSGDLRVTAEEVRHCETLVGIHRETLTEAVAQVEKELRSP